MSEILRVRGRTVTIYYIVRAIRTVERWKTYLSVVWEDDGWRTEWLSQD